MNISLIIFTIIFKNVKLFVSNATEFVYLIVSLFFTSITKHVT